MAPPRAGVCGAACTLAVAATTHAGNFAGFGLSDLSAAVGTVLGVLPGRDAERAAVAAVLDAARAGSGGALVIRGVPGSGKSTLLADAVTAAAGMRVLRTSGVKSESPLAFAALQLAGLHID